MRSKKGEFLFMLRVICFFLLVGIINLQPKKKLGSIIDVTKLLYSSVKGTVIASILLLFFFSHLGIVLVAFALIITHEPHMKVLSFIKANNVAIKEFVMATRTSMETVLRLAVTGTKTYALNAYRYCNAKIFNEKTSGVWSKPVNVSVSYLESLIDTDLVKALVEEANKLRETSFSINFNAITEMELRGEN